MQLYDATCRPGGQVTHEVPKYNLTRSEIILLRHIHGDDAVVNIRRAANPDDKAEWTAQQDYRRLGNIYGQERVEQLFNVSLVDLGFGLDPEEPKQTPKVDINAVLDAVDAAEPAQAVEETAPVASEPEQPQNTEQQPTLE